MAEILIDPERVERVMASLFGEIEASLGEVIESLTVVGSTAAGQMSLSRPDVNVLLCLKRPEPDVYLTLGEIFRRAARSCAPELRLIVEFRPFRFVYPYTRGELDVFVNPLLVNLQEAQGEMPFGLPKYFLQGLASARKVIFGSDVLAHLDLEFDRGYLLRHSLTDLAFFRAQLARAPMSYDLERDCDLFFNESLTFGKLALSYGVELAMTDEELAEHRYLEVLACKGEIPSFYERCFDPPMARSAELILASRDGYHAWKNDPERATALYGAAFHVLTGIWLRLLRSLGFL